jgi:hypothetical protein
MSGFTSDAGPAASALLAGARGGATSDRPGGARPPGGFPVASDNSPEGTDPTSGRDFITDSTGPMHRALLVDLEYACTFPLATPRACDKSATAADPTLLDACECLPPAAGSFTPAEVPAVCNSATPTRQDYAKAYPTVRELLLTQLLGKVPGANAGVVSSICPIHAAEAQPGDPLYGYRPAISALVSRLKGNL